MLEGDIVVGLEDLVVLVEFSCFSVLCLLFKVIDKVYDEVIVVLNVVIVIIMDLFGCLVIIVDGVVKMIDLLLENFVFYEVLMNNGYLFGFVFKDGVLFGSFLFLVDKSVINSDMLQVVLFLVVVLDKVGLINEDMVVYIDLIFGVIGVMLLVGVDGKDYVDFSNVIYDCSVIYIGMVIYFKSNGDGIYSMVMVLIIDVVFGGIIYMGMQFDVFIQVVDDVWVVIEYVYDNLLLVQ